MKCSNDNENNHHCKNRKLHINTDIESIELTGKSRNGKGSPMNKVVQETR